MQTEITNHYGNLNIHGTGTGGFQNPAAQNLDRETRTGETVILGEAVSDNPQILDIGNQVGWDINNVNDLAMDLETRSGARTSEHRRRSRSATLRSAVEERPEIGPETRQGVMEFVSRPTKPEVAEAKTGMEKHPIQCTKKELEEMFEKAKNNLPLETLINGDKETTPPEKRWSFDKETLTIHNDNQWKGFFPADQNLAIQYLGGFWKRFYQEDGVVKGITHPVEVPFVYADSRPQIYSHPKYGEVVLLKYISPQNAMFYDVLKIVDKDTIVGKAFLGIPPNGLPLLTFSMSRKYGIERMAEEDHEKIFQEQAQRPPEGKVIGEWAGKLVSDGGLSPESQRFTFTSDKSGELKMRYIFARLLAGNSRVEMTPEQMNTYDWTNWHDEIKMVTDDLMVGKWCSPTTRLPLPDYAPGFLSVEKTPEGNRCSIRYILERK